MSNAEAFLDIYNEVDKILESRDHEEYETFARRVKKSENPLIKRSINKLLDYGELRNAIVHNCRIDRDFIAEPHLKVVNDFKEILDKLKSPKKVIPLFQFEVLGASLDEKLDGMLKLMHERSFSQFPVYDLEGNIIEIINTNTISRWLGSQIEDDSIITNNPQIEDLIEHIEFKSNFKIIPRDCDIYTAHDYFIQEIKTNKRNLDVLLITHSGKKNEKILGLITIEDIADKF